MEKGDLTFVDHNTLADSDGDIQKDEFKSLIKSQQNALITKFKEFKKEGFEDSTVYVSLDILDDEDDDVAGKDSFWLSPDKIQQLKYNTVPTRFHMGNSSSKKAAVIYVPAGGADGSKNQAYINNCINAIEEYQKAIKDGLMGAGVSVSFNLYSMSPDKQLPLTDILKEVKDDKGNSTYEMKSSNGVKVSYSFSGYFHPLVKVKESEIAETDKANQKMLKGKVDKIKYKAKKHGNLKLSYISGFLTEYQNTTGEDSTYSKTKKSKLDVSKGFDNYKVQYQKIKQKATYYSDTNVYLAVPKKFSKSKMGDYDLSDSGGYKTIDDIRVVMTKNKIYKANKKGKLTELGDYSDFNMDVQDLVLARVSISDGKDTTSRLVGAVIPLAYKETVVDTSNASSGKVSSKDVYYTGRTVQFSNDYGGKIKYNTKNKDLLSVYATKQNKLGVELKRFAFPVGKSALTVDSHTALNDAPKSFQVNIDFQMSGDSRGLVIYRNNAYIKDNNLLSWLKSDAARALEDVKAKELYDLITGDFDVADDKQLTYEQWLRLQDMKEELDTSFTSTLKSIIHVVMIIFGVLLIFYAMFMMMAWWIDIFNVFFSVSLLYLITFKHLYPVSFNEDVNNMMTEGEGQTKYVTFWKMLIIMIIAIGIGLIFIYSSPILELLVYLYFKISSWTGM